MGLIRYILVTFKNDLRNNLFYMNTMIFSIAIIFNTFNVIFNEKIIPYKSADYQSMSILGLIILGVSILFMIMSNSYYLEDKYKEYGVISMAGRSVYDICSIVTIRNLIVSGFSVVIGCIIGSVFSPIVMEKVYKLAGIDGASGYISVKALSMTILIIVTQFLGVFLINTGSIYRKKVNELMDIKKRAFLPDTRRIRIHPLIYIGMYLMPIVVFLFPISAKDKVFTMAIAIFIASFGTQGIIRHVIPEKLFESKSNKLITDKYKIILISNLQYSIQKSIYLIVALVISTVLTTVTAGKYEYGSILNIMSLICYVLVIMIMSITIIYKFLVEAGKRRENYRQLRLLGYTRGEIKTIIGREVFVYYMILILLALIHMLLIVSVSIMANFLSFIVGILIIVGYVGLFTITGFISYCGYKLVALIK